MRRVLFRAAVATLGSVAASVAICWLILTSAGGEFSGLAIPMSVVCPLAIAFPASAYTYYQKHRIELAHAALAAAHRELETASRKLAELARKDDMTGLLNRRAFVGQIAALGEQGFGGAMLLIDADKFKWINDTFGHPTGDKALRAIAHAIRDQAGHASTVGRLGGEEFGIFLAHASIETGEVLAEHVRRAVENVEFRSTRSHAVKLTVSIGVAHSEAYVDFSTIMSAADRQLYEAKRNGRNQVSSVRTPARISSGADGAAKV